MKLAKNSAERASRGEVIITQKEAKGEYGSSFTWKLDSTTYGNQLVEPHVFDNTNGSGVPARMSNYGATYGSSSYCTSEVETSDGDLLMDGSQMFSQKSCKPNTGNAGNYYDFVAAAAGNNVSSGEALDSICPNRWRLPNGGASDMNYSFAKLVNQYAANLSSETTLRESAASFIRGGMYSYSYYVGNNRGTYGCYWSNQVSDSVSGYYLDLASNKIRPNTTYLKGYGLSVRCVAR